MVGVDSSATASKIYQDNFPDATVYCADVADPDFQKAFVTRYKGDVTCMIGGPPCQGFTRRNLSRTNGSYEDMNRLPLTFIDLALRLNVEVIVMEEVKQARILIPDIIARLERNGFACDCQQYNAAHYAVPQKRSRLILVATRHPWTYAIPRAVSRDQPVTVREAFATPPEPTHGCLVTQKAREKILGLRKTGTRLIGGNYDVMRMDRPAPTILTKTRSSCGPYVIERNGDFYELSLSEIARLQSFPSDFILSGTSMGKMQKLLGNAVPPELARRVAINIGFA